MVKVPNKERGRRFRNRAQKLPSLTFLYNESNIIMLLPGLGKTKPVIQL